MTACVRRRSLVIAALVLAVAGTTAPARRVDGAGKEPIHIGMIVALTGYLTEIDGPYVDGVKLAVGKINAAGGMDGHEVQLHIVDGASTPTTGVTMTNQLLNQYRLSAMINGASSATNQALVPIIATRKVPVISQGQLPEDPSWIFLATAYYQKDLELQLAFAAKQLGARSIAFLYSQTPYGQLGVKYLPTVAAANGLKVALELAVDARSTDLSSVMAKVKDAAPDAVVDFLTGSTHIVEAKGAATVGLKVPIVMGIDATDPVRAGTQAYPNTYFVATPAQVYPAVADPALKAACQVFVDAYTRSGKDPSLIGTAGYGWDAIYMIAKAVDVARDTSVPAIRAALENLSLQGSQSLYRFTPADHTGQVGVPTPLTIAQVQGSTVKPVFTLK